MNDATTSEKAGQLLEDLSIVFAECAGHPRIERKLLKIRSTALDLQGHILHLEQKANAESDCMQDLYAQCTTLRADLAAARAASKHLEALLSTAGVPPAPSPKGVADQLIGNP